jgi:uncharacterized protein (TIGR00369 family)
VAYASREELQQLVDDSPFGPWWGFVVESAGEGGASVRLPHRSQFERPGGILHGGCAAILADVAVWVALLAEVEGAERAVTVHLATDYLAAARGDITGTAQLLKVGRRLAVASVETRTAAGILVSVHQVTYARAEERVRRGSPAAVAGTRVAHTI